MYDDFDFPTIQERGPYRVFSQTHPLGNPAEVEAFLAQGERWVSAEAPMDIADMEPGHAMNAAQLVIENARRIDLVRGLAFGSGVEGVTWDPASDDRARRELASSNLVRALLARASTAADSRPSWAK